MTAADSAKPRHSLKAYLEPKTLQMLLLGISSGLPFLLIGNTLGYWMRDEGASLAIIGYVSWVGLAYSFKPLWAPLVDRVAAPLFAPLGRRRSWMALSQIVVGLGLTGMAAVGVQSSIAALTLCALLTAFAAATQDIVVDAWRIESAADNDELGLLSSAYQFGYRVALLATDAIILALAEHTSWSFSYAFYGALMGIGLVTTFFARESKKADSAIEARPPLTGRGSLGNSVAQRFAVIAGSERWKLRVLWLVALVGAYWLSGSASALASGLAWPFQFVLPEAAAYEIGVLIAWVLIVGCLTLPLWIPGGAADAIAEPFIAFFATYGWIALLILVAISFYRVPDFIMGPMVNPYYHDIGLTKDTVAAVRGTFSFAASLAGIAAGGFCALRFGYIRALIMGGILQAAAIAAFAVLSATKSDVGVFIAVMIFDSVATSFAGVALVSYMSSLTSLGYTATQYSLLAASYTILGKFLKGFSGEVVEWLGRGGDLMHAYAVFFIGCGLAGIPGLVLFLILSRMAAKRTVG